jgi:hypothetical protein
MDEKFCGLDFKRECHRRKDDDVAAGVHHQAAFTFEDLRQTLIIGICIYSIIFNI